MIVYVTLNWSLYSSTYWSSLGSGQLRMSEFFLRRYLKVKYTDFFRNGIEESCYYVIFTIVKGSTDPFLYTQLVKIPINQIESIRKSGQYQYKWYRTPLPAVEHKLSETLDKFKVLHLSDVIYCLINTL